MKEDDLSLLGVAPSDRRKLEAMGFTTLEQIVLLDRYSLGMGKDKSDALVQRAANILANRHVKDVQITSNQVIVQVDEASEPIVAAVKEVIGEYGGEYIPRGNQIFITPSRSPYGGDFHYIIQRAQRWQTLASAKSRNELAREGITLKHQELMEFAQERGLNGFCQGVFSEIKGNETIKKAISVSMFSTFSEPVHTLIIGEPATGKTLAKEIIIESFSDIKPIGANATRAGLVCNMATGELGALASADKETCIIDEFDKIPDSDIELCYELLSNGKCSVDSGRIHTVLESHFIAIALANPREGVFRGRPMEQVGMPPTLLSRFAFIVRAEPLSREDMKELARKKLLRLAEVRNIPEYYDQWVKLARLHRPTIKASQAKIENYLDEGSALIERYSTTAIRRDLRMTDYLKRIPDAMARAEFSDVTNEILGTALELIEESISAWD